MTSTWPSRTAARPSSPVARRATSIARKRAAHRAGTDVGGGEVGDHDPAGLGLPPVVVHGQPERFLAPDDRLWIERFTDAGDEAQVRQVVVASEVGARLHQHSQRRRCRVPDGDVVVLEDPVPALGVELGFVDDAGDAVCERGDDPVRHSGDPTRIGGAPEHVVVVEIERDRSRGVVGDDGVVHVDRSLGRAGRTAREVQQGHVLGIGWRDHEVVGRAGEQIVEQQCSLDTSTLVSDEHDVLERRHRGTNRCHPAPVERRRRDEDMCVTEYEALTDRLGPERGEQWRQHTRVLERADGGDVQLRDSCRGG